MLQKRARGGRGREAEGGRGNETPGRGARLQAAEEKMSEEVVAVEERSKEVEVGREAINVLLERERQFLDLLVLPENFPSGFHHCLNM
ncbi:hypothetical protein Tco_1024952 [Tanacetum coccineum]